VQVLPAMLGCYAIDNKTTFTASDVLQIEKENTLASIKRIRGRTNLFRYNKSKRIWKHIERYNNLYKEYCVYRKYCKKNLQLFDFKPITHDDIKNLFKDDDFCIVLTNTFTQLKNE
jgi:hypothetical protein